MKVSINKQDYEIADGTTLLAALNQVVSLSKWQETTLNDGDKITVIKAFYGG